MNYMKTENTKSGVDEQKPLGKISIDCVQLAKNYSGYQNEAMRSGLTVIFAQFVAIGKK